MLPDVPEGIGFFNKIPILDSNSWNLPLNESEECPTKFKEFAAKLKIWAKNPALR